MQQNRIRIARIGNCLQQGIDIGGPICFRVLKGDSFETNILQDLRMVGPARHTKMDACDTGCFCKCGRKTHRARAPGRLHPFDPSPHRRIGSEHIWFQSIDKAQVAFGAEIALGILRIDQPLFGSLDRAEDGCCPVIRAVDAHPEINFVVARILRVHLDEREQRVGGLGFELVKHARLIAGYGKGRNRKSCCGPGALQELSLGDPKGSFRQTLKKAASAASWKTSCNPH